ncbi:hypothetical protein GCM10009677_58070 [Sphaerisporangium rubeum]|uniref:Aminoglycoside phosphotransferase n=1 Tax=Sphaerisporangium rubeum TaxID=321317 RepID=A0A7X0IG64_9ACTN|nr:aminoglycoside phosphotransferase [Sphaerisporangium rubeum]
MISAEAVRRLVDRELVGATEALDGLVEVLDLSRSNGVFLVSVAGVPRCVVKHHSAPLEDHDPFDAERSAYAWFGHDQALAPRLLHADTSSRMLVLEAITGAVPLHEARNTPGALRALARLLAGLHARDGAGLPARRPWILDLPHRQVVPPGELVDRVMTCTPVLRAIEELGHRWRPHAPVHGDVKFDNVLVAAPDDLWLVDWEFAGLGEPAWDLAGIVDGVAVAAALTGPVVPEAVLRDASPALSAYRDESGDTTPGHLAHAVIARLTQSVFQLSAYSKEQALLMLDMVHDWAARDLWTADELAR